MNRDGAFVAGRVTVDAYGNGGFRFADMSHKGSVLMLPDGVYGWAVTRFDALCQDDFARVFARRQSIGFLLLGCGPAQCWPDKSLRAAFDSHTIGLEVMDTGAAVRTYNILLGENRPVAAALISVESHRQDRP